MTPDDIAIHRQSPFVYRRIFGGHHRNKIRSHGHMQHSDTVRHGNTDSCAEDSISRAVERTSSHEKRPRLVHAPSAAI